jgi:hypothetical protein
MTVTEVHGGEGVNVPLDNIYMRAAESAAGQEWGRPPVFEREGGSIPIAALFTKILGAPVILLGTGLPDDNMHAPNEKYHLPNFYHNIRQVIRYLDIIGQDPAVLARPSRMGVAKPPSKARVTQPSLKVAPVKPAEAKVTTPMSKTSSTRVKKTDE